ncbi:selenocysteine-specific translation elongation factor [Desulfovibrio inopinatus]|uniref:selenocysteine-specific translation elongation factor n=1 Tax=Desulfovibrio inopinatus TaxID=102109 RepID=UPI0004073C40|nr:selenocysteine-specific translation elongation factor [Desulfovibrio inopinatus]
MPVIMGTAGHIDHGKTTLVKALTGIDCDRLAEEKKRGITIELGFAFMDLAEDLRLGVVDVPGHERFVKNMVAGAAGIDFVLLVIAADEGIMPQTREHLEICTLLGISTGLVALTKVDMVDEEWLEMVTDDVSGYLGSTFLADAPIFPVSAHTGQGLDDLKAALVEFAGGFAPKRRSDLFRLPVDRVFTMKGHGTVVTGTLVSGAVKAGDDIMIYPQEFASKARTVQSHGEQSQQAEAGQRTAVNLLGLDVADVSRGDVVASPDALFPNTVWDVELTCLASSPRGLKHRTEVHFHHGTREVLARLYFLDRDKLEPGERALCQVVFPQPMVGMFGDRCVVRTFSPLRTVAGAHILRPEATMLRRRDSNFAENCEQLSTLISCSDEDRIRTQLMLAGPPGLQFAQLVVATNIESKTLERLLQVMGGKSEVCLFDKERRTFASGKIVDELTQAALSHLEAFHRKEPMKLGMSRGELASAWGRELPAKLVHFIVEKGLKSGLIVTEQDVLRLPQHRVSLASDTAKLKATLTDVYTTGELTPPNLKDVLAELDLNFKEAAPVYKLLQDEGIIVKLKEDMYVSAQAIAQLIADVRAYFQTNDEMGPTEFKTIAPVSRKFAIPLMEYLDKQRITIRVGDKRRLRG